ncbi:TPA_exp: putative CBF/NF-Y family transcription factor [Trichophyton benhamiae CBS 112371]|uniref:DNA polymerase epsilon subunit D n=1 Tax=Arthroderma benhamiae (strain ATCC MYA-4681 / CBS 112371) TaxID=663331 RepID=D4B3Y4_ARTBC|nr:CBF/NF-Y family transcription factor, putative [Trichophyton benhamiae CBS 112371]EFE29832.1 CBF/NF-Y family transcription factor, putative [Trichophyton benhamiae CBS 112371]DAA73086.1 TPA_exp: putative CBF/NF-Y family transcription factor [Trichophyton benhamiae CBS 112371]
MSTNEAGEPNGRDPINTQGETDVGDNAPGSEGTETGLGVDDILLPRSVIMRLAKDMLPPGTGVQRDAVTAILKAATVFVSYISSHANDMTDKKTLTPQDVLAALTEVELGDFRPHLEQQLKAYTALMNNKRESKKKGKPGKDGGGGQDDDQPGSKRLKRDGDDKKTAAPGAGTSSTAGATARETGSRNPGEALDDDDDTEPMDDTNLSNEEDEEEDELAEDETESQGEQDEDTMDRIEDSDSAQRRAAAAGDSGDSDSD